MLRFNLSLEDLEEGTWGQKRNPLVRSQAQEELIPTDDVRGLAFYHPLQNCRKVGYTQYSYRFYR